MNKLFVRCCDTNKPNKETGDSGDNIYLDWENLPPTRGRVPVFRYMGNDEVFEYCPWCGILLDTNLDMTPALEA